MDQTQTMRLPQGPHQSAGSALQSWLGGSPAVLAPCGRYGTRDFTTQLNIYVVTAVLQEIPDQKALCAILRPDAACPRKSFRVYRLSFLVENQKPL
jgi:hypothetical protein